MIHRYMMLIEQVRKAKPLIHHITNYVTVNDCANITLGIGASPVMADALEEVEDIAGVASAVVLNMGTLNERTVRSMILAGKAANQKGAPVVFDPVGVGASQFRNETARQILDEVKVTVLRGNISEIKFIAGLQAETKGVDASSSDMNNTENTKEIVKELAAKMDCVIAVTGPTDIVSNGKLIVCIQNGHQMLAGITGTGCMCTSLIGSFCGAVPNAPLEATVTALLSMGIAGEIAFEQAGQSGNGSYHMAIHDAISLMNEETLTRRAKISESSN